MDSTITNMSQLQKALRTLTTISNTDKDTKQPLTTSSTNETNNNIDKSSTDINYEAYINTDNIAPSSKFRTSASQFSTSQQLHNLAGLQTTTNSKLDLLNDSISRFHNCLENMLIEQRKQTELLASIARNTMHTSSSPSTPIVQGNKSKSTKGLTTRDYGFSNPQDVVSELLIKILKEIEVQVKSRGIKYRSSRTLTRQIMNQAVKIACDGVFNSPLVNSESIKIPENQDSATSYVASRVGAVNDVNPILTPQAIRELFDDHQCRTFMSAVEEIVERLRIIRIILPYYEADMINAISYPYFDSDGNAICDWSKLNSRNETKDEATVITLQANKRAKLGRIIAKSVPLNIALNIVLKE